MPFEFDGQTYYTVTDCNNDGYIHYPLVCIHCQAVNEMMYCQSINDGYCKNCNKWHSDGSRCRSAAEPTRIKGEDYSRHVRKIESEALENKEGPEQNEEWKL